MSVTGTPGGTFASANAGAGLAVTVTGLTLTGAQSSNYSVAAVLTATITPKSVTITGVTANNKVYDATTTATLSGTATLLLAETAGTGTSTDGKPYTADTVSVTGTPVASFATSGVGVGIAVAISGYTLGGSSGSNYTPAQPTGLGGTISVKALSLAGLTASNKVYDGTTATSLTGTAALLAPEAAGTGATSDGNPTPAMRWASRGRRRPPSPARMQGSGQQSTSAGFLSPGRSYLITHSRLRS